jgi:hypothetical protein
MSDPGGAHIELTRAGSSSPWVGQLVPIDVALWRPKHGEGELPPFSFDDPELPGTIALFRSDAPPPSEVTREGVLYLVQHRTLLVFPQEDGELVLPPLRARYDDPTTSVPVRVRSEPLHFSAAFPRGLAQGDALLVARDVRVETTLDRSLTGLKVGDGFTRSVVLTAVDTDPVMLPQITFEPVEGLRIYPTESRVLGTGERGVIEASRSYAATYVVERAGHYELPELRLRWLDPTSGRYTSSHAASLQFWARPNFSLGLSAFGTTPWLGLSLMLAFALVLAGLGYVTWRRLQLGPFAWERRWAARQAEQRAFLAFERALGRASAVTLLGRAYAWLALRLPDQSRTLARLRPASPESAQALRSWEEQAFAGRARVAQPGNVRRVFARARRALGRTDAESSIADINSSSTSREETS